MTVTACYADVHVTVELQPFTYRFGDHLGHRTFTEICVTTAPVMQMPIIPILMLSGVAGIYTLVNLTEVTWAQGR